MALQASGAISLANIQTEFGGSNPIGLNEYYRDGAYVGAGAPNVPTSGVIDLQDFYGAQAAIVLNITGNTSNYNILTAATAAGYTAGTDTTPIIVNVATGVTVSASSAPAMRTGALNAASNLTINVASGAAITGFTGSTGGTSSAGGAGGDGILFEISSGTGTYLVDNDGTTSGGGGGGGGGGTAGSRRTFQDDGKGGGSCLHNNVTFGSNGAAGAAGGLGQNGSAGSSGNYPGSPHNTCPISTTVGSGAAGGAAGKAVNKGGLTVSTTGSGGTFNGAVS